MTIKRSYLDDAHGQAYKYEADKDKSGRNMLILLHAPSDTGSMYEAVLTVVADAGFHTIAMDLPGYGNSDNPERTLSDWPRLADFSKRARKSDNSAERKRPEPSRR